MSPFATVKDMIEKITASPCSAMELDDNAFAMIWFELPDDVRRKIPGGYDRYRNVGASSDSILMRESRTQNGGER